MQRKAFFVRKFMCTYKVDLDTFQGLIVLVFLYVCGLGLLYDFKDFKGNIKNNQISKNVISRLIKLLN